MVRTTAAAMVLALLWALPASAINVFEVSLVRDSVGASEEYAIFLEAHKDVLRELSETPGVDRLSLGVHRKVERSACLFHVSPPPRLMYFALEAGVQPEFYVQRVGD